MATSPAFTATPRISYGVVSLANVNRDGSGTIVDVITGASGGTKINEVIIKATGQPADSVVTLFLYDGVNSFLLDEIDVGAPAAASSTVTAYRNSIVYANLILPSSSWRLRAAVTVNCSAGVINVIALGGDF